jgi:hypothetical protein
MSTQPVESSELWAGFEALDSQQAAAAPWDEPIPLTARRELPAFPTEVFPAWLGDFVRAVAGARGAVDRCRGSRRGPRQGPLA